MTIDMTESLFYTDILSCCLYRVWTFSIFLQNMSGSEFLGEKRRRVDNVVH